MNEFIGHIKIIILKITSYSPSISTAELLIPFVIKKISLNMKVEGNKTIK